MREIEGGNARGQPPEKWRDRVQEYVRERGEGSLKSLQQVSRECLEGERWKLPVVILWWKILGAGVKNICQKYMKIVTNDVEKIKTNILQDSVSGQCTD